MYYPCDESVGIGDMRLNDQPVKLRAVMLRIGVDYDVNLLVTVWRRHFMSKTFTWVPTADGHVWFEGDVVQ